MSVSNTWQALFAICAIFTGILSIRSVYSAVKAKPDLNTLVDDIKQTSKEAE